MKIKNEPPMPSGYSADYEEYAREHWGPLVTTLQKANHELRAKLVRYENDMTNGYDVGVLMRAIADNPAALAYWNKILIMLRLES